eukprot:951410-Pyramimonas_sp.AAC.1
MPAQRRSTGASATVRDNPKGRHSKTIPRANPIRRPWAPRPAPTPRSLGSAPSPSACQSPRRRPRDPRWCHANSTSRIPRPATSRPPLRAVG